MVGSAENMSRSYDAAFEKAYKHKNAKNVVIPACEYLNTMWNRSWNLKLFLNFISENILISEQKVIAWVIKSSQTLIRPRRWKSLTSLTVIATVIPPASFVNSWTL